MDENRSIFLFLLVALLLLLIVAPQVVAWPHGEFVISVLASLLQIAAILVLAENHKLRWLAWMFGLPTLLVIWSRHILGLGSRETAMVCAHGLMCIFLIVSAVLILQYVLTHDVTADNVIGAACAYLLIGVVMGHLCFIVETVSPDSFRASDHIQVGFENPDARSSLLTYYSFSTLTTSGYGDIVPNRPLTRTMAWMEAVAGQFYLAVLVAGMVSIRVSQKQVRRSRSKK